MSKAGPAREALNRVLADGEWHHVDDLMSTAMKAVPFPVAVRRWVSDIGNARARLGRSEQKQTAVDDQVAAGARQIAHDAIRGGVRTGVWERIDDRVRLRPEPKETSK